MAIRVLACGALALAATSPAEERPPIAEQISKAQGLDSFGQVEALRYTFNLDLPALKLARSWVWEPKTDRVSYEGKDKAGKPVKVTYLRSELWSQPALVQDEVEPAFVNDQYWLLFPMHVSWDGSARVEDTGKHELPLGKGSAERVLVKYPADTGYTPGDTWELYVGPDHRIEEFIYHRGGPAKPSVVITTWRDYRKAGPLVFSLDHRGTADGKPARISFSDVAVKLAGSERWTDAK
jgi:hypothetical protein